MIYFTRDDSLLFEVDAMVVEIESLSLFAIGEQIYVAN